MRIKPTGMRHEVYRPTTDLAGLNARLGFGIHYVSPTAQTDKADCPGSQPLREAREQFERAYLQQQLVLCNGKVGKLAQRVGMERTHLYRKLRSLGVDFRSVSATDD